MRKSLDSIIASRRNIEPEQAISEIEDARGFVGAAFAKASARQAPGSRG